MKTKIEYWLRGTNFSFSGWEGGVYKNQNTKLVLSCPLHGQWNSTSASNISKIKHICLKCYHDKIKISGRCFKLEEKLIHENLYVEGTKFVAQDSGNLKYWCPVCSTDEFSHLDDEAGWFNISKANAYAGKKSCRCSHSHRWTKEELSLRIENEIKERNLDFIFKGIIEPFNGSEKSKFKFLCKEHGLRTMNVKNFLKGKNGCSACSGRNQKEAYINIIKDNNIPIAIKFGIANCSDKRLKSQNRKNLLKMENIVVYKFKSSYDCRNAENACLNKLDCRLLSSKELKDGWTETTSIKNLEEIISIYESFGGVKLEFKEVC